MMPRRLASGAVREDGRMADADGFAGFAPASAESSARANRTWWDGAAAEYLRDHDADLGGRLLWGPEGLDEAVAGLLGEVAGRDVLEVGAGAAQCAAWLAGRGARVVATDLSAGMLRRAEPAPPGAPGRRGLVQCDARALPLAPASFDVAFSAYGALPFVADVDRVLAGVARVLRPGGRWVFSVTHPFRWVFPDDAGPAGLRVGFSYFDRTPYVEKDEAGSLRYAEHHRTAGDWVRLLVGAGFAVDDLVEPEWPDDLERSWGGWSPLRGRQIPGTAIFVTHLT
jgi:SAM-dependent methyltransferase